MNRGSNESPSMFVMRTFAANVDAMDERELIAMANWIADKSRAVIFDRGKHRPGATSGSFRDIVARLRVLGSGAVGTISGTHCPLMNDAADAIDQLCKRCSRDDDCADEYFGDEPPTPSV